MIGKHHDLLSFHAVRSAADLVGIRNEAALFTESYHTIKQDTHAFRITIVDSCSAGFHAYSFSGDGIVWILVHNRLLG